MLLLRGPPRQPDDAARLVELLNDLAVSRWLARVPHPYTAADAAFYFKEVLPCRGTRTPAPEGAIVPDRARMLAQAFPAAPPPPAGARDWWPGAERVFKESPARTSTAPYATHRWEEKVRLRRARAPQSLCDKIRFAAPSRPHRPSHADCLSVGRC